MKYIVEINKENPLLAIYELNSRGKVLNYNNDLAIVDIKPEWVKDIYGYSKRFSKLYEFDELIKYVKDNFKVEGLNASYYGGIIYEKTKRKVNVKNPEQIIRVYKFEDKVLFGIEVLSINSNYLENRNRILGVSSATIINPRIARAMLNLVKANSNDLILDPFCGAGGILLESKWPIIGCDKFINALAKAKLNKIWFRKDYKLILADAKDVEKLIKTFNFTKIVTDFPYGLRSKIDGTLIELIDVVLKVKLPIVFLIIKDDEIHQRIIKKRKIKVWFDFYVRKGFYRRLYLALN